MANTIKPYDWFLEHDLPTSEYYKQFKTATDLEVGGVYRQPGPIYYSDYKIVWIGEGVALGVEVSIGNNNYHVGEKCLFEADGARTGWKYSDARSAYRLEARIKC